MTARKVPVNPLEAKLKEKVTPEDIQTFLTGATLQAQLHHSNKLYDLEERMKIEEFMTWLFLADIAMMIYIIYRIHKRLDDLEED